MLASVSDEAKLYMLLVNDFVMHVSDECKDEKKWEDISNSLKLWTPPFGPHFEGEMEHSDTNFRHNSL